MWDIVLILVLIWFFYHRSKKKKKELISKISVSMPVKDNKLQQSKNKKRDFSKTLKKSFKKASSVEDALNTMQKSVYDFIENHSVSVDCVLQKFQAIDLPENLLKKELCIRKKMDKCYKNRENYESKSLAIYLAFKHAELLILNPRENWKNFSSIQKLQSNLKAEEYFEHLLVFIAKFAEVFKNHVIAAKILKDIDRIFELWCSCNIAYNEYKKNCKDFQKTTGVSDKHFMILHIIDYLERRYKFNPRFREELISWCYKDIKLYDQFLIEFNEYLLFTADEQVQFMECPELKADRLNKISFDDVKCLKKYFVPRLNSFEVLWSIYNHEADQNKLDWLTQIAQRIKYMGFDVEKKPSELESKGLKPFDLSSITQTIEISKSDKKGKLGFLNSKNQECSTEDAFKDYMEQKGWYVMRAEVSFWQAMFCLSFWEEIFRDMDNPSERTDIPFDLFKGAEFYLNRQQAIDEKAKCILHKNLSEYIGGQIQKYQGYWTRLIYNGDQNLIEYFKAAIVQSFLETIDVKVFQNIVYRIAQNPNKNRAGIPDFVIWNDQELKMIEVKKVGEKVGESQLIWIKWMISKKILVKVVRVKGC